MLNVVALNVERGWSECTEQRTQERAIYTRRNLNQTEQIAIKRQEAKEFWIHCLRKEPFIFSFSPTVCTAAWVHCVLWGETLTKKNIQTSSQLGFRIRNQAGVCSRFVILSEVGFKKWSCTVTPFDRPSVLFRWLFTPILISIVETFETPGFWLDYNGNYFW